MDQWKGLEILMEKNFIPATSNEGSQLVAPDHQVFSFQDQKDPHMIIPET